MYNPPNDGHVSTGTEITQLGQFHYHLIHPGQRSPDSPLKSTSFTVDFANGGVLPTNLGDGTGNAIDITSMTGDVDLTSWMPTGVPDGAIISIRKAESSGFKIKYTDTRIGITYDFVDKKGETMTFIYEQPTNSLRLI